MGYLPEQNCGRVHHLCTAVCPAGPGCRQSLSLPQLQARYHSSWPPLSELVTRKQEEVFVPPSCTHFTRDEKKVPCWKQFIFNACKSRKHGRGLPFPSSALTKNLLPSSHPVAAVLRTLGFHLGPRLPEPRLPLPEHLGPEPGPRARKSQPALSPGSSDPLSPLKSVGGTNREGPGGEEDALAWDLRQVWGTPRLGGGPPVGQAGTVGRSWLQPATPRPHARSHAEPRHSPWGRPRPRPQDRWAP